MIPLIFGSTRAIPDLQTEEPIGSSTWRILPRENTLHMEGDPGWNLLPLTKNVYLAIQSKPGNETH